MLLGFFRLISEIGVKSCYISLIPGLPISSLLRVYFFFKSILLNYFLFSYCLVFSSQTALVHIQMLLFYQKR